MFGLLTFEADLVEVGRVLVGGGGDAGHAVRGEPLAGQQAAGLGPVALGVQIYKCLSVCE